MAAIARYRQSSFFAVWLLLTMATVTVAIGDKVSALPILVYSLIY